MKPEERKYRISLTISLSVIVFILLLITYLVVAALVLIADKTGTLNNWSFTNIPLQFFLFTAAISLFIGTVIVLLAGKYTLNPVNKIINAMNRLAAGDFKTRLQSGPFVSKIPFAVEMRDSFNTMASELENTEILRADFINNFSHEFKTPIVSIAGFAKLLKHGDLTEEEKKEYLDVIEKESLRLSDMATNILNLSKVENQTILTNVEKYNLSEQIRSCVLLLENKWTEKNIDIDLNFTEHYIEANKELLSQIWLNLLDNAVKFSPEYGTVGVEIEESKEKLIVKIINTGAMIPENKIEKIFTKFYQADESHAAKGNGIGLAIVKKVTELHNGKVSVESNSEYTCFCVELPTGA